ncbi:hypothetical protein EVAR_96090_1 [Eumeta japonica]|uniref:Uncharacterized protein n=1 Tax=Eumeta variegata TaxID=151549 RepID=A0A4C1VFT4_EUMVA|nr:hypothetical protein EVAR_96090_1 [Eumeta japonica]
MRNYSKTILWPTRLQYKYGPIRLVKYHTLAEYRCEVEVSAVVFHQASQSSCGPLLPPSILPIRYLISTRKASNALVIPLGLRVSLGSGDHPLSDFAPVCLPLEYSIRKVSESIENICRYGVGLRVEPKTELKSGPGPKSASRGFELDTFDTKYEFTPCRCWQEIPRALLGTACKLYKATLMLFPFTSIRIRSLMAGAKLKARYPGLFEAMNQNYDKTEWRLFIDSSKYSLKAVLLHNGNKKPSIPIGHAVNCKESYETMRTLINLIKYKEHKWKVCGDLKVIGMLVGLQGGYTKYCCFLCLWDSRAKQHHYVRKEWPVRNEYIPGKMNINHELLVDQITSLYLYTSNWGS